MDTYCVLWLLDELKVLTAKGVISEEEARRISVYYRKEAASPARPAASGKHGVASPVPEPARAFPAAGQSPAKLSSTSARQTAPKQGRDDAAAIIPVLLSVTASVLIAAGLISLIAYNWTAIPRTLKAAAAFAILLAAQAGGVLVAAREKLRAKAVWREGAAVLWALLFGGAVAFISQICRLPGNAAAFVLVWAVSSILIAYALQSVGAFVLSLALSCAYTVVCRVSGGEASLFYLLFAALCPFALRMRGGRTAMLVFAAVMLGAVLEKGVPGLWAVCGVSFAVLCLEYGRAGRDRPVAYLAAAGLCLLLLALSYNGAWEGVGWRYLRTGRSPLGTVLDCLLALGLTASAVAVPLIPVLRGKKKPSHRLVYPLCALSVAALYAAYSLAPEGFQKGSFLAPAVMVLLFSLLFLANALYAKNSFAIVSFCLLLMSAYIARLSYPVLAVASFLLLFEAAGRCRASKPGGEREGRAVYAAARIALALWVLYALVTSELLLFAPSPSAVPFQLVLYGSYTLVALVLLALSGRWRDSFDLAALVAAMSGASLCLLRRKEAAAGVYPAVLLGIALLMGIYGFVCRYGLVRWRRQRGLAFIPYMAGFLAAYVYVAHKLIPAGFCSAPLFFLLCAGVYFYMNAYGKGQKLPFAALSAAGCMAAMFIISFWNRRGRPPYYDAAVPLRCVFLSATLFLCAVTFWPLPRLVRQKRRCNYVFALYALAVFAWLPGHAALFSRDMYGRLSAALDACGTFLAFFGFVCIFLCAGYYIYSAYREGSLALANAAGAYAALALVIKFFSDDYGFVAKGVLFILLGVAMFLLNVFLLHIDRTERQAEEGK